MRFDYGYDRSYDGVPKRYHVVCIIPRGRQGLLVQRRTNEAEYSLPTFQYKPDEMALMKKVRHAIANYTLQQRDLEFFQFDELWQPTYGSSGVASVDVYYGVLVKGAEQVRAVNPHLHVAEVSVDNLKTVPFVGLELSGDRDSWKLSAQARLLFDGLSVLSAPFREERESFDRVDEIGFELPKDRFSLIFNGEYLAIYSSGQYQYFYRIDPLEPLGRRVGRLESLVASDQME